LNTGVKKGRKIFTIRSIVRNVEGKTVLSPDGSQNGAIAGKGEERIRRGKVQKKDQPG